MSVTDGQTAVFTTAGPLADGVHYIALAAGAVSDLQGAGIQAGKRVVELAVLHVTKGDALARLRQDLAAEALLYSGDDVTDERAFRTLEPDDLTVRGGPGDTAARFRVDDPPALATVLGLLADLCTGA